MLIDVISIHHIELSQIVDNEYISRAQVFGELQEICLSVNRLDRIARENENPMRSHHERRPLKGWKELSEICMDGIDCIVSNYVGIDLHFCVGMCRVAVGLD